jgi:hypothetical protein
MRVRLAILAAVAGQLTALPLSAQQNCPTIEFEHGEDVTTVGGTVKPEDEACYRLEAEAGESFTLNVIQGDNIVFSVAGVADARDRLTFTAESKSYKIVVGQLMRGVDAEAFKVAIVRSVAAAAKEPSHETVAIPGSVPPEMRQKIATDVAEMLKRCRSDWPLYASFHDCQCLAGKFVEARLRDPGQPGEEIGFEIRRECVNPQGIITYMYDYCFKDVSRMNLLQKMKGATERQWASYCKCFAATVAKTYASAPDPSYSYIETIGGDAFAACPRSP